jgi:hypothetical protein
MPSDASSPNVQVSSGGPVLNVEQPMAVLVIQENSHCVA